MFWTNFEVEAAATDPLIMSLSMKPLFTHGYFQQCFHLSVICVFLPAGVNPHIFHHHRNGRRGSLLQCAKVNAGGEELEPPHYDIWISQRNSFTLPPHWLFHWEELEKGNNDHRVRISSLYFMKWIIVCIQDSKGHTNDPSTSSQCF